MKFVTMSILALAVFASMLPGSAFSQDGAQPVAMTIDPLLRATCHDGNYHRRLNAIDSMQVQDGGDVVHLIFRTYMVDCVFQNNVLTANYYGPLFPGRCDHSIRPYPGVSLYSQMVSLNTGTSGGMTNACGVVVTFRKENLANPGTSDARYVYRYDGTGDYIWLLGVRLDPATGSYVPYVARNSSPAGNASEVDPTGVGNNLDHRPIGYTEPCNGTTSYAMIQQNRQAFAVESPVAKVSRGGATLNLTFYTTGITCRRSGEIGSGIFGWVREPLRYSHKVIMTNSAGSPIGYDWNRYDYPIDRTVTGSYTIYDLPLSEVMEPAELAKYRAGQIGQVVFKIFTDTTFNATPRGGHIRLIMNLDPKMEVLSR